MRQKNLRNFVNDKFKEYVQTYDVSYLSFNKLSELAKADERLSELAYLKYMLSGDERYKLFSDKSKYNYESTKHLVDDYDNKYVWEYNAYLRSLNSKKVFLKGELLKLKENNNLTMYALSKALKTNQSNASQFFLKGQYQALSEKKLKEAYDHLKAKYEN